jgi:hypothetical protein
VARGGGVKGELRIDAVVGARDDAHAAAELVIDDIGDAVDSDDQVGGAESVLDRRKGDAPLEVIFGAGLIEKRVDVSERRPQRVFDVVAGDRIFADRFAGETVEGALALDQENHRGVQSGAALRVDRVATQARRRLGDEADGGRAAQHARRD